MMTLPPLNQWDSTRAGLHRAAQVVAAVRVAVSPPLPNALRHSLYPVRRGLTTGPLPLGGELLLDFGARAVFYMRPALPHYEIPAHGDSQTSLAERLLRALAQAGHSVALDSAHLDDSAPLEIDAGQAADYAAALYTVFTAAARFRARLFGPQSPVVVWPHNFDLSTLWFAGAGSDENRHQHLAFGFAPASQGFARPYLYAYARPHTPDLSALALPAPAYVHDDGWTGVVVDYDDLVGLAEPDQAVEALYADIYRALLPLVE